MIYLNIQTEQRTTEYIDDETTIPVDDARVSNYFKPKPNRYRGEWIDGTYTFVEIQCVNADGTPNKDGYEYELLPKDADGNVYKFYTTDADGNYIPDDVKIQEEETRLLQIEVEERIKKMIQEQVDIFNAEFGLSFPHIYRVQQYSINDTYEHQARCLSMWTWNEAVWMASRQLQVDIISGSYVFTTVDDFMAQLPVYQ